MWALDRGNGPVPLGDAVPVRHQELHHLEHRRQDRHRAPEHRSAVQGAGPESRAVLLEHAQLLAARLSSRPERAVRAVCRQLHGHDVAPSPAQDGQPAVPEKRVGSRRAGTEVENFAGVAKVEHVDRRGEDDLQGPGARQRRHARDGRRPRVLGRSRRQAAAPSTPRAARRCGKRRCRARSRTARSPTRVNGKQYLAVLSGEGALTGGLIDQAGINLLAGTMRSTSLRYRSPNRPGPACAPPRLGGYL